MLSRGINVSVCVSVCVSVWPPTEKAWTFRYPLDTLDLYVTFEYIGPLVTFWIPQTFRYLLDTLDLYDPFGYLGPVGRIKIP